MWLDPQDGLSSIRQQCGPLGLNRSSLYSRPAGGSEENLALMRLLDEQYTRTPCYGVLKMAVCLRNLGHVAGPKRQAFAAYLGAGGGAPEAQHQQAEPGTQSLSLSVARTGY